MDDEEFADCEIGKEFWWGEENKDAHKYFIRFEEGMVLHVLKEQIGQGKVSTFYLQRSILKAYILPRKTSGRSSGSPTGI